MRSDSGSVNVPLRLEPGRTSIYALIKEGVSAGKAGRRTY